MKFRKIQDNTNWTVYNNIVNHNVCELGKLRIPLFLKRSFSKLIAFYPFTDNQEKTYFNLPMNKRIPFLFRHLIKIARKKKVGKSVINRLIELKKEYDTNKDSVYSDVEYTDRLRMYMISKDYDSVLDLHLKDDKLKQSFSSFAEYQKLIINKIIDNDIIKIRKNHKNWQTTNRLARENDVPEIGYGTAPGSRIRKAKKKSKSMYDLKFDIGKMSEDVSEWDKFIEEEVQKRLEKAINQYGKKDKISGKKRDYDQYGNSSTSGSIYYDDTPQHVDEAYEADEAEERVDEDRVTEEVAREEVVREEANDQQQGDVGWA